MKYVRFDKWWLADDSIHVDMVGEDEQIHGFDVSAGCAGVLAAVLAAGREKLDDANEQQFIRPTGMQTGQTAQGEPMLFMVLEGGTELPLVFRPEALGALITELEKLRSILQPGSQIRWQ
ncbi:MAG TPA: hypothetical protein VLM18_06725 [Croceibacterium sp.]|nr:hypothetical protein [Croceibacterium sp.]